MKYVKAQAIFPKSLLDEIQKYVQGTLVYIPKSPENRQHWGANTDTRDTIARRNKEILRRFHMGVSTAELAEAFYLSESTIKKIVYRKTN